jgi:hypothetical protein
LFFAYSWQTSSESLGCEHCGERHLHRYFAGFDFRFNNRSVLGVDDNARTVSALKGISGKRLTDQQAR